MFKKQKKIRKPCLRALKFLFAGVLTAGAVSVLGGCAVREHIKQKLLDYYGWEEIYTEDGSESEETSETSQVPGEAFGDEEEESDKEFLNESEEGLGTSEEGLINGQEVQEGQDLPIGETTAENTGEIPLPSRFDYRDVGKQPEVRDQGRFGTCWAFASLMAMESSLLPEESWKFSADHMSRKNSFFMKQEDGGQYAMSMAYLLAWQGPVLEEDDPYGDGISPDGLSPVKHVREIRLLESKNYQEIKRAVYQVGGVQSSLFTNLKDYTSRDQYYNETTYGYYYSGEEKANHNVVIIGWDDNYPKENFKQQPKEDGAFICQNSWGPRFGEQGCFYVSYEDTNIGDTNVYYTRIDTPVPGSRIYQSDLCGWIGQIGYGEEDAYFAAVYQAEENEYLTSVGFYATMPDTRYTVYAAEADAPGKMRLSHPLAQGSFKEAGFYTVELEKYVKLKAKEKFTVVVYISTPGAVHPVAIEYQASDLSGRVDLSDGEGYLSSDGKNWVSAEKNQNCNICLKAYTLPENKISDEDE